MKRSPQMTLGFTLIELSIVLVIIGLIVGGILVGRDLIDAAAIRAQISQIEKYQTAVNTFKVKYGYLPGDIPDPYATQYGFQARGTSANQGDGDGVLRGTATYPSTNLFNSEATMFWTDLSQAGLIPGSYGAPNGMNPWDSTQTVSQAQVSSYLPAAVIGRGNVVYAWEGGIAGWYQGDDRTNYLTISVITGTGNVVATYGEPISFTGLTVFEAYSIDTKIDDGLPNSGSVTSMHDGQLSYSSSGLSSAGFGSRAGIWAGKAIPFPQRANQYTCHDYTSGASPPVIYSVGGNASPNNSDKINCALSFVLK